MVERSWDLEIDQIIEDVSTKEDIKRQLEAIGIQKGMLLMIQGDIKNLGYICGGAQALLEAIMDCIGFEGTIVMPSFTPDVLDPACMKNLCIDKENWEYVRKESMPFDKKLSAPNKEDELVLQLLRNDGVVRSYHPNYSFVAWGKYAKIICDKHALHFGLSKDSPLGRIYELNGFVLMLGKDYKDCTMFHLAHYNGDTLPIKIVTAPIEKNNKLNWKDMLDLDLNDEGFDIIGEIMEERKIVRSMYIGTGQCRLYSSREAVNIATSYFNLK